MNKENIGRQKRIYMLYNLIAFTIIFSVFGLIIYLQISSSLFSRVDKDLVKAKEAILQMPDFIDGQLSLNNEFRTLRSDIQRNSNAPRPDANTRFRSHVPMRVTMIVRDINGEVQNGPALGRMFWESYLNEIPFSSEKQGVTSFRLAEGASFRGISFAHKNESGEHYFVQLISNVDGEQGIIDSFLSILVVCVTGFIFLSISASAFLATKSMQPLLCAWKRQTEFVENASHELRTPLTIIQNKLEALLREPNTTIMDKADNIALSLSETRRLSSLTADLMTLARADSNQTQILRESFDIDALISELSEPYAELAEMQEKTLTLDLKYSDVFYADKSRIHELMVILLDNALKYTNEGDRIELASLKCDGKLEFAIRDTGSGMSEEARKRAFDRFYREDKARTRENGGSGLGLSIAKWIADVHGASIKLLPNQPKGTVIEIKFPK